MMMDNHRLKTLEPKDANQILKRCKTCQTVPFRKKDYVFDKLLDCEGINFSQRKIGQENDTLDYWSTLPVKYEL